MMLMFNDENNDNDNHNQKQQRTAYSKESSENLTPPIITNCKARKALEELQDTYLFAIQL